MCIQAAVNIDQIFAFIKKKIKNFLFKRCFDIKTFVLVQLEKWATRRCDLVNFYFPRIWNKCFCEANDQKEKYQGILKSYLFFNLRMDRSILFKLLYVEYKGIYYAIKSKVNATS